MGSAFIKLSGKLYSGDYQSTSYNEPKTAFLRVSDIEEICDVQAQINHPASTQADNRERSRITEKEYNANPDLHKTHYFKDGSDQYWKFHDTVVIILGVSNSEQTDNIRTIGIRMVLIDTTASQVVKQIDNAIVDFEVRKAIAIKAGTEAKPK